MKSNKTQILSFDIDEYNSRECQVHNHGFYLGEKSKQGEVDKLQTEIYALQERIDDLKAFCIKGVESNMLSIEYNQALIDMHKILKGEETK